MAKASWVTGIFGEAERRQGAGVCPVPDGLTSVKTAIILA
jgi:hypothetical protein